MPTRAFSVTNCYMPRCITPSRNIKNNNSFLSFNFRYFAIKILICAFGTYICFAVLPFHVVLDIAFSQCIIFPITSFKSIHFFTLAILYIRVYIISRFI